LLLFHDVKSSGIGGFENFEDDGSRGSHDQCSLGVFTNSIQDRQALKVAPPPLITQFIAFPKVEVIQL
jgi:hypothetical protein